MKNLRLFPSSYPQQPIFKIQLGKLNTVYNVISEELKTQYEERIAHLEKEIEFLRGQLAANS